MGEVEGRSYKDGSRSQVVQKYRYEVAMNPSFEKHRILPLKLDNHSFSTEIERYPKCTAHYMKACGCGTAGFLRQKGITHGGNAH